MKNIIFDLGGVLLHEPERNLSQALQMHNVAADSNTRIFNRMFEFASLIAKSDYKKAWFVGTISSQSIVDLIELHIEKSDYQYFFKSDHEKQLIKYGTKYVLLSHHLSDLTFLDEVGFDFVQKCKEENKRVLVLSNWDPESFALIKNKFADLFNLFDYNDIFVPSITGFMKPEKECFAQLAKMANIRPSETLFIDDGINNANSAKKFGFGAIHHQNWEETKKMLNIV